MGCCGCSARATTIFAAIYSLIVGSCWLGVTVTCLLIYQCDKPLSLGGSLDLGSDFNAETIAKLFLNILALTYLYNDECPDNVRPSMQVNVNGVNVSVKWTNSTLPAVATTYKWMLTYTVLNSVLIAASILLLIIAVSNKKGTAISILHFPWIITIAALLVTDVWAAISYFLDIQKTMGTKNFLTFIGMQNIEELPDDATPIQPEILTAIPSITMGIIFARGFIFWFVNLSLFIMVLTSALKIGKQKNTTAASIQSPAATSAPWLLHGNTPGRSTPPVQQRQLRFHEQEPPPTIPKPQRQPYQQPGQYYQAPPYTSPPQGYDNRAYNYADPADRVPTSPVYYELKPQVLQKEPVRVAQKGPPTPQKPAPVMPLRRTESNSNELRSQLPWSYVQHRDEPINVKRQQKIDEDSEDAPPIPIPDYTLHFPRRPRGDHPRFGANNVNRGFDVHY